MYEERRGEGRGERGERSYKMLAAASSAIEVSSMWIRSFPCPKTHPTKRNKHKREQREDIVVVVLS